MSTAAVNSVITRGGNSARAMSEEPGTGAAKPSTFDVWTHSYDGLKTAVQAAGKEPKSFLTSDPAQFARAQAAAMNMSHASANQIENSISAQASALSESANAVGQAQGALQTVGATFALLTGVEQMLSSVLSAIPFPALPAVRIADVDIGLPHAHAHPPNLVPPAPPVPLPSMGPVIPIPILSGSTNTLINGMPAGRCGDMGLGVWCGGYFPMYEVFLGSSSVWIEGARAARVLVDITKHCTFTVPKPQDSPLGPMLGTTVSCSPNVLIGGVPMPSLTALALGAAMKGVFTLAGKGAKAFARVTAPLRRRMADMLGVQNGFLRCKVLRAEPVNFVTGEVFVQQQDYSIPGLIPLEWNRHYGSHSSRKGVCGYGWSTPADARLVFENDGAVLFYDGRGGAKIFPYLPTQETVRELVDGATLEVVADGRLRVRVKAGLTYLFSRSDARGTEIPVQQLEDRCGNYLRYRRDEHGLREIVESAGRRIEIVSERGLVREMWLRHAEHEAAHLLVWYEYSEAAELLAVYDAFDHPYRFRYEHQRLVQHTDRNGLSFYYAYDNGKQSARCNHAWGDGGLYNYRFEFDPSVRRVSIKDSLGAVSSVQLNELSLPIWEIDPLGGITRYEYDDRGRTTSVLDQDGHRTGYEYDDRGNLIKLTLPDGKCTARTFDAEDKPLSITDPGGAQWQQKWDARGLLVEQISPLGHASRYEYDVRGLPVAFTNARGARTELSFDRLGNLTLLKDAYAHSTRFSYDARGNITDKIDKLDRKTLYRYDAQNRLKEVRLPSGASLHFAYDAEGNLVRLVDENGAETRLEYFGQGEVARRIQPDGHSVQYHYDTEERLIGVTNQRGETYRLKRDALGRIVEEIDYWGQSRRYKHSPGGRIRESIDSLGRKVAYVTDPLGRILKKTLPDPHKSRRVLDETFEYDARGNLVVAANAHVKVERSYDAAGRLVEEKQGDHFAIRNRYDESGNRVSRRTVLKRETGTTEHEVRYVYDALDRAIEMSADQQIPIKLERNALGQIVTERFRFGVQREVEYDTDGHVTRRRLRVGAKDVIDVRFNYDVVGNLVERRDSQLGADRFLYDPMGRVTQHIDPTGTLRQFLSDPAGDLLHTHVHQRSAAPGSVNDPSEEWSREGAYEGSSYRFDRMGNLIGRRDSRGELALVWDAGQRLIESRLNDVVTTYGYDSFGRRIFKQTGEQKTVFSWDGEVLLDETVQRIDSQTQKPNPEPQRSYEHLCYPGTFEPLLRIDTKPGAAADVFYYHNDPNGCPSRLTDERGAVKWAASYSVWGEVTRLHASHTGNALRLQGQYFDEETGLHYNRHRYYDPHIGQFVTPDPLGLWAGDNLFRFASNPFAWVDPLGLKCTNAWNEFQQNSRGHFPTRAAAAASYNRMKAVQAMTRGSRPDVSDYLPQSLIDEHLAKFDGGGAYFAPKDALDRWGRDPVGRADGQFVMSAQQVDDVLARTGGDMSLIERDLGIPPGSWAGQEMVVIKIDDPNSLNLRMPTGNESGANDLWQPGGKLPTGYDEAVVDAIPQAKYQELSISDATDLATGKPKP